jgi:hypothetical protein
LSLENNGGFASVRCLVGLTDLSEFAGLAVRVRGDGRPYQLRLRGNDRFDGVAYCKQAAGLVCSGNRIRPSFSQGIVPAVRDEKQKAPANAGASCWQVLDGGDQGFGII